MPNSLQIMRNDFSYIWTWLKVQPRDGLKFLLVASASFAAEQRPEIVVP